MADSLTEYQQQRRPQPVTIGEIAINPKSLHRELMCPICLDILTKTMTTRDCLHRFCSDCINKAIRSGNKECPTCRKKLASHRSLRADPNFDEIISKIYPSRREIDNNNVSNNSNEEKITPPTEACVEVILRSFDDKKCERFIKCSGESTIGHLSLYLAMRPERSAVPNPNCQDKYCLATLVDRATGEFEQQDSAKKLKDIDQNPLELYYFIRENR